MPPSLKKAVSQFLEQKKGLKLNGVSLSDVIYPLLTIGVCIKNSEVSIGECLTSVVNSNYDKSKLEIIVVDGLSTDNTLTVVKKILEKSSVQFQILSDEGKGLGYARQLVVDNAKSKYVCWIDGDNILPYNFLKNHVIFAEEHQHVSLFLPLILFNGAPPLLTRLEGYRWLLPSLNAIGTQRLPFLAMQGTLVPLDALKNIGGFNTSITGAGEDTELFTRMRQQHNILMVNPHAMIYHIMRSSWKSLTKQIMWWAKTQPCQPKLALLKQFSLGIVVTIKQFPLIIAHLKDPIGFLMPLYITMWNGLYFMYSIR